MKADSKDKFEDGWEEGEKAFEETIKGLDKIVSSFGNYSKQRGFISAIKNSFETWK
jgi:hypothetical protein